jgi:predicted RNA-binding Zn ribbon-like protein
MMVKTLCYHQQMRRAEPPKVAIDPDDLPLLGEPLAVELANSLYFSFGTSTDFIATASLLRLWAGHVHSEPPLAALAGLRAADVLAARELRDAVRQLLEALAGKRPAPGRTIKTINRYAGAATTRVELAQGPAGELSAVTRYSGPATIDAFLGRLAIETIVLAAHLLPGQLRRCEGPGCAMLFVRTHHRRQWCHASCGHRARQASYYRRKSATLKESRQ